MMQGHLAGWDVATAAPACVALAVALSACVFDLRNRRIPNGLTLAAACLAIGFHLAIGGGTGALRSVAGFAVGFGLFLPLFVLGGMGAGDLKLIAAIGAWLGPAGAAWAVLYSAVAGGVMAVGVAVATGRLRTALTNVWVLLCFWRLAGIGPVDGMTLSTSRGPRLPYALPIAAGLCLTLWLG